MKTSSNWLRQYVAIDGSADALAEKLTMAGIEVEAIERGAAIPVGVVVGEILERAKHPDADKLSVCRVSDGKEEWQVVCGAPNCDAGKRVPFATVGTEFADPKGGKFQIKKRPLRGVDSSGMLCSADELGMGGGHHGLLELPLDAPLGAAVSSLFPSDDIFTLEITPNRPDCLSHWGVAREVAAVSNNAALKFPEITLPEPKAHAPANLVEVREPGLCPRYTARIFRGVKVKDSPDWLKQRLVSVGLRPINNVVDITNFVLLELGQPLHAFDLDLLEGGRIVVRRAAAGETIVTLDGRELKLDPERLVIADASKPMALAGVMGGEHSGVSEKTVNVLLESACFNPANIRKTSKVMSISSDSSYRFERGVDYEMVKTAGDRAAALILELTGGELVTELVDVNSGAPAKVEIPCDFDHIRRALGTPDLSNVEIVAIFARLRLPVERLGQESCVVVPPSFRGDLLREADLVEEVARIHGLDKLPVVPIKAVSGGPIAADSYILQEAARDQLVALGLHECCNYTLVDSKLLAKDPRFAPSDLLQVKNPISSEQDCLRPSLFQGMLKVVAHNVGHNNHDLRLFEIGNVFCADASKHPEQRLKACLALSGRRHPERFNDNSASQRDEKDAAFDFFDLKGLLESWMDARHFGRVIFAKVEHPLFAVAAELRLGKEPVALFGQVAKGVTRDIRLRSPLFVALVELGRLLALPAPVVKFKPLTQYPATQRDVAVAVAEEAEQRGVLDFIKSNGGAALERVELADIYRDQTLGAGRKSLKYTLTFRLPGRTLTDDEVNAAYEAVRAKLAAKAGLELR